VVGGASSWVGMSMDGIGEWDEAQSDGVFSDFEETLEGADVSPVLAGKHPLDRSSSRNRQQLEWYGNFAPSSIGNLPPMKQNGLDLDVPLLLPWEGKGNVFEIRNGSGNTTKVVAYLVFEELLEGMSIKQNAQRKRQLDPSRTSITSRISLVPLVVGDMWYYHEYLHYVCHYGKFPPLPFQILVQFFNLLMSLYLLFISGVA